MIGIRLEGQKIRLRRWCGKRPEGLTRIYTRVAE